MSVEAIRYQFKKYKVGFFRKQSRLALNLFLQEPDTKEQTETPADSLFIYPCYEKSYSNQQAI